jgi:aspartyl-tRNA(Asn)/glutamyl-tRNA(Gln) amidotransferase subunit A
LWPRTIDAARTAQERGAISAVALVERCLTQIERFESEYRAWVVVDAEGALRRAAELDALRQSGQSAGPLHGSPLGIKDIFDVAGFPTLAGSALRSGHVAAADAPLVARLRRAGAIILGKTVTTEFACFDPPPSRNPWNPSHTPGGSSSGSAVGVALGMCLGAIGSQTGGSITRPASYCGVWGAKPTFGALDVRGMVPVSFHLDHPGPIGQSAADLQELTYVMAGRGAKARWRRFVEANPAKKAPPRLGLLGGFFRDEADAESNQALDHSSDLLRRAGATVVETALPESFARVHQFHARIMAVEAALYHRESFERQRGEFSDSLGMLLEKGLKTRSVDYAEALAHRRRLRNDFTQLAKQFDALICLATPKPAPGLDTTGDPRFNSPWSYAGLPTVSCPIAVSPAGLPIGLQCVGEPWSEPRLFSLAAWCGEAIGFAELPPPLRG